MEVFKKMLDNRRRVPGPQLSFRLDLELAVQVVLGKQPGPGSHFLSLFNCFLQAKCVYVVYILKHGVKVKESILKTLLTRVHIGCTYDSCIPPKPVISTWDPINFPFFLTLTVCLEAHRMESI